MTLQTALQVLFYLQVARISTTTGFDERAILIVGGLGNIENPQEETYTGSNNFARSDGSHPEYKTDKVSSFDRPLNPFSHVPSYQRNVLDNKPKRGWEDLNIAWRRSPKRAWEVVNRMWRMPNIRRRYKNYLHNGKRSEEVMENIPVQQDNKNPTWMVDEIGYDIDLNQPLVETISGDNTLWHSDFKRGWEDLGPYRLRSTDWQRLLEKRSENDNVGKRGWEDISWKRDGDGMATGAFDTTQSVDYGHRESNQFDYNTIPLSYGEIDNQQPLSKEKPDMINILIPDSIDSYDVSDFMKQYDKRRYADDFNKPRFDKFAEMEWEGKEYLNRASYTKLCRIVFGNVAKCRSNPESQLFYDDVNAFR